jgi:hypothetical protein
MQSNIGQTRGRKNPFSSREHVFQIWISGFVFAWATKQRMWEASGSGSVRGFESVVAVGPFEAVHSDDLYILLFIFSFPIILTP